MKNTKKYIAVFLLVITVINTLVFVVYDKSLAGKIINNFIVSYNEEESSTKKNPNSYWSTTNKPVFYGATKITIKKGMVDNFDVKDTRFRVFAKDFEDGDLTDKITHTAVVDVNTVGTYTVTYKVKDSHDNETTLEVPVIVTDDEDAKINVERTLYTTPSVWNMDIAGFTRCNYGDRQLLGMFMPSGSSIRVRTIEAGSNIVFDMFANDSAKELWGVTLTNDGEWMTLKNDKTEDTVPFLRTTVLNKEGTVINKTYKIEVEYDDNVKELDYYHYGDNEENFFNEWRSHGTTYAVVENEVLTVVCPLADIDKMVNHNLYSNGFTSLTQFFDYYQKAVDKMDAMVGLELNPTLLTDQNVRTKYLVKPNVNGAGGAYYHPNHVGIHSDSISAFFQMNWGGLHEIAHGYQGNFGKGVLAFGEVSNNILGHYVQTDKSIYFHPGDWLGELKNIESAKNTERLDALAYDDISVGTRLYMIINLLDRFEGEKTYSKLFSWYRKNVDNGTIVDKNKNSDYYVLGIGELYHINVAPYFEAWGVDISDSVKDKMYEANYPSVSILGDMVSDSSASTIMKAENLELKYGLVLNDVYKKYDINDELVINISIDDLNKVKGKSILIKDNTGIIKTVKIDSSKVTIPIDVGIYNVVMPILNDYSQEALSVEVIEGKDNTYTYKYKTFDSVDIGNYNILQINGIYDTWGYKLTFMDKYTKAKVEFGQAGYGSVKASIKILDLDGDIVSSEESNYDSSGNVSEDGVFFNFNKSSYIVDLKPGYVIEVSYGRTNKVIWKNALTGKTVSEFTPTSNTTRYTVIEDGIKVSTMSDDEANDIKYNSTKEKVIEIINDYKTNVSSEELNNRNINFKEKSQIIYYYSVLRDSDKIAYSEFIDKVKKGGTPEITYKGKTSYTVGDSLDLLSLITVSDNEDGNIKVTNSNTRVVSTLNLSQAGNYNIVYEVTDSDGNVGSYAINVSVVNKENTKPSETPTESKEPVVEPTPSTTTKPSSTKKPSSGSTSNNNSSTNNNNDGTIIEINDSIKPSSSTKPDSSVKPSQTNKDKDKDKDKTDDKKDDEKGKIDISKYYIPIGIIIVIIIGIIAVLIINKKREDKSFDESLD